VAELHPDSYPTQCFQGNDVSIDLAAASFELGFPADKTFKLPSLAYPVASPSPDSLVPGAKLLLHLGHEMLLDLKIITICTTLAANEIRVTE